MRKILIGVLAALAAVALVFVGFKAERLAARALQYERFVRRLGGLQHRVRIGEFQGVVILPKRRKLDSQTPWVWYRPAVWGGYPGQDNQWLFRNLLCKGISVAGIDVGESYGTRRGARFIRNFTKSWSGNMPCRPRPACWGKAAAA